MKLNSSPRAFTIIELLAAMSVVAILLVVLVQVSGYSNNVMKDGLRRTETYAKARGIFDLVTGDVSAGLFRSDLAAFRDENGSVVPAFYTRRVGVGGDRALSLVAYQNPATAILKRAAKTVPWDDANGIGFNQTTKISRLATVAPADYEDVASGVLRMEIYFIKKDGAYQNDYTTDCKALGIALAVVDDTALRLLEDTNNIATLTARLPVRSNWAIADQTKSYEQYWGELITSGSVLNAMPSPVRNGVRIFETTIPLP